MEAKGAFYDATSSTLLSDSLSLPATLDTKTRPSITESTSLMFPESAPAKSPDSTDRHTSASPSIEHDMPEASGTRSGCRTRSAKVGSGEKRKRSRVTPEQLSHLERFFSIDRSPTAARRKEISQMLGMQERQTQIWFQNRRAKAKLLDGKGKPKPVPSPPRTPPELRPGREIDLQKLIHEDDAISIIPSYELTIGSWRRLATPAGKHDLITYVCENRRCFVWYVQSAGYGFKIEVPFHYIKEATYCTTAPGRGLASFYLTQPPMFFIEQPDSAYSGNRSWKRSADWTESSQASHELRHDLIASSAQLAHVLRHYNLPLATPSSEPQGLSPVSFPSTSASAVSSASTGCEPASIPRLNDSLSYGGRGFPEQPSTLRSSAVNPIEMQRQASYASLRSAGGFESLEYSLDMDPPSRSGPSLQPSPAPSYGSPSSYASPSYTPYSQLAPSPGPASASYSSSSPGPGVPQYTGGHMYSTSHNVLDDATHAPLSSRGYGATAYGVPTNPSTSPSAHSAHFAAYGMPAPSTSPSLVGMPYPVAQGDLGVHASSGVVPQPSGLVGDASLLHGLHYDDGHQAHHRY